MLQEMLQLVGIGQCESHSPVSARAVSHVDQVVKGDGVFKWDIGLESVERVIEAGDEVMRKDWARTAWSVEAPVIHSVHLL